MYLHISLVRYNWNSGSELVELRGEDKKVLQEIRYSDLDGPECVFKRACEYIDLGFKVHQILMVDNTLWVRIHGDETLKLP